MERTINLKISGWLIVLVQFLLPVWAGWRVYGESKDVMGDGVSVNSWVILGIAVIVSLVLIAATVTVRPNQTKVFEFMGKYKGSFKQNGFWAKNPFWGATDITTKLLSYQSPSIEVNEKNGIPIQIAVAATYQISDTYAATYAIENGTTYVVNQFEICLRELAKKHTYNELVSAASEFATDLETHLEKGGYKVVSARITELNYAPEISAIMLQKQAAAAMGEARQTIVENAIKMAKHAKEEVTFPTKEAESKFVSNLILLLCSERPVTTTLDVGNDN